MSKRTIRVYGHPMEIHVDAHQLAQRSERFRALREDLHRKTRDPAGVDALLERHLGDAFGQFASRYYDKMARSLDTIFEVRAKIKPLYDGIIEGKLDPATAKDTMRFFDQLAGEMDKLHSPAAEARSAKEIAFSVLGKEGNNPALEPAMVAAKRQAILDKSTDAMGFIRAKAGRIAELRARAAEHRARGNPERAAQIEAQISRYTQLGIPAPHDFKAQLSTHPHLMAIAEAGGLPMLQEQWVAYNARPRKTTFAEYVQVLQTSQVRGTIGEFDALSAFGQARGRELGLDVTDPAVHNRYGVLKGPDHNVSLRGTDAVLLDGHTGEIIISDNKATHAGPSTSVTALVENLSRNMIDDAALFKTKIADYADTPPDVRAAVERYTAAANELQAAVKAGKWSKADMTTEAVQKDVTAILAKHNIRRVVTTSHGAPAAPDVKAALGKLGIGTQD